MDPTPFNPAWRTDTVVGLCQACREGDDYDALPILADALQDAGCDDEPLLSKLRALKVVPTARSDGLSHLSYIDAQRTVAIIMTAETEAAVRWLEQFVRDINYSDSDGYDPATDTYINERPSDTDPHTYGYVIDQGREGAAGGTMHFASDAGADYFRRGKEEREEFFLNWALATGITPPDDEELEESNVSCAC